MNDPAVSKARDILQRLSADSEARRAAEERERAQITRRIEDGALRREAEAIGEARAQRRGIRDICRLLGIEVGEERAASLEDMDATALATLCQRLMATRAWP